MDSSSILGIATLLIVVYFFFKLFADKLKYAGKIMLRALVAFFGIWAVNIVGAFLGVHMGLNLVSAFTVGILGVPGIILLFAVKYFI